MDTAWKLERYDLTNHSSIIGVIISNKKKHEQNISFM